MSAYLRRMTPKFAMWSRLVFYICCCILFPQKTTGADLGALPEGRLYSRHVMQRMVTASHGGTLELRLGNRVMNARCRRESAPSPGPRSICIPCPSSLSHRLRVGKLACTAEFKIVTLRVDMGCNISPSGEPLLRKAIGLLRLRSRPRPYVYLDRHMLHRQDQQRGAL